MTLMDFEYPATTDPESLWRSYAACRRSNPDGLVVIFSTYQSIDVIHEAQALGVPEFELIVCDEAHRTTGNVLPGVDVTEASHFMKVHYDENVRAKKRLYMTATPRIYGETAKRKGAEEDYTIASMDDESIYGPTAYQIKFGEAVEKKLLTDYKVVVLTVQEDALGERVFVQGDKGVNARALEPSDIGKIIGCWKGLIDHGESVPEDATGLGGMLVVDDVDRIAADAKPLHRAVGFCSTINDSKTITEAFAQTIENTLRRGTTTCRSSTRSSTWTATCPPTRAPETSRGSEATWPTMSAASSPTPVALRRASTCPTSTPSSSSTPRTRPWTWSKRSAASCAGPRVRTTVTSSCPSSSPQA